MIKYEPAHFEPLLKEFVEPKQGGKLVPYVAFGRYLKEYRNDVPEPHIFVLPMGGAHAQLEQLAYYVKQKGFRPLKWHLPVDQKTGDGRASYAELDAACRDYVAIEEAGEMRLKLAASEGEKLGLQAALKEAQDKLAAKTKKAE